MSPVRSHPDRKHLFFSLDEATSVIPLMENHAHSHYSDGSSSLAQVVLTALKKGITQLIMTEHTEPNLAPGKGWFTRYMQEGREIREMIRGRGMDLVMGLEVPITDFDGGLMWDDDMARDAEFVLGAVHAYPGHGWDLTHMDPEEAINLEYRGLLALLDNPMIDAIAHPGGVCQRFVTPFPIHLFEDIVKRAVEKNVAVELNPAYLSPMAPYAAICCRHGVLISPGSNAHAPAEIGRASQVITEALRQSLEQRGSVDSDYPGGCPGSGNRFRG